jgi:thiol-disulfide isomerase/thioredoxin
MKNILCALLPALLLLPLSSFNSETLVGHPMPLLPNKTLSGKTIDENYFKGHVTIVTLMAIGCMPCMYEISWLNKIQDEYAAKGVQVLCVARQMRDQMVQFNSDDKKSYFFMLRNALKAEPIRYDVQPACADKESNAVVSKDSSGNQKISLTMECNTLEDIYGVTAIPATFYVDKKGIIRKTTVGGPDNSTDTDYYTEVKKEIDRMLSD